MLKQTTSRLTFGALLIVLAMSLGAEVPADAGEVQVNGLPCNDLCQAWLGYNMDRSSTGSTKERNKSPIRQSIRRRSEVNSERKTRRYRSMAEFKRSDRERPVAEHPEHAATRVIAAKRAQSQVQTARKDMSRSSRRLPLPGEEPMPAAKLARMPTPRSPELRPEREENTAAPDANAKKAAPLSTPLSPEPPRSGMSDRPEPPEEPAQTAISVIPVAPAPSAGPPAPVTLPVIAIPSASDTLRTSATPGTNATRSVGGAISNRQEEHTPVAAAARPSVVAALPPTGDAGSSLKNDSSIGGTIASHLQSAPQPAPTSTAETLSVKIGQISAERNGTDVHVLVINASQVEVKDVDVTCRASDAQGQHVGEASTHIGRVAPTDVALDRVLFRLDIATKDERYTCAVDKGGSMEGRKSVR